MLCLLMLAPGLLVGFVVITSLLAPVVLIGVPFMLIVFGDTTSSGRADPRPRALSPRMAAAMAH